MVQKLLDSWSLKYFSFYLLQKNIVEPWFREVDRFSSKEVVIITWVFKLEVDGSIVIELETVPMVMQSIADGYETDSSKIQLMWERSACCVSLPCSVVITLPDDHLSDADGCCTLGLIHWCRQAEMWVINWRRSNTRRKEKHTHLEEPAHLSRFFFFYQNETFIIQ